MRVHDYIQASAALIQEGKSVDAVLTGLKETLSRRGHKRLLPRVLSGLLAHVDTHTSADTYTLTVAREADRTKLAREIDTMRGERAVGETRIDGRIIGGYILEGKNTIIDASYKTSLRALYNRIIKQV